MRLAPHQTVTLKVRLRAKYPIRAHTFQSRVYEYYDPDVSATGKANKAGSGWVGKVIRVSGALWQIRCAGK